ncbi:MAG TPA: DinB family protein [Thermoanaerobaculia bacterium]|nr:DinB family protein [Thermoanaerobaculia bacterium]
MRRACERHRILALFLAAACAGGLLAAPPPAAAQAGAAPAAKPVTGVRGDVLGALDDAEKKLTALAQATPAEKLSWRPATGVRSTGEVFMHVANGNYLLPTFWGAKPPAGVDRRGLEKEGADKDKVLAALKASFAHLRSAIAELPDQNLERQVDFFGNKVTVRQVVLQSAVHAHEHLGQSIAYARMNGIVPPWSAAEQPPPAKPGG